MIESEITRRFEEIKSKGLACRVFIEIPLAEVSDPAKAREGLLKLERDWMTSFNNNPNYKYQRLDIWNEESGVGGLFGDEKIDHSKFYRFDGTLESYGEGDYRASRGFLIRDHDDFMWDFVKVHFIADNLCGYLAKKHIAHKRVNFNNPSGNYPQRR